MPTKKAALPTEIYQIKVTLIGTDPPIWRRLQVPADVTFEQLHYVLQIAMGWQDCHLHEFSAGGRRIGPSESDYGLMGEDKLAEEAHERLSGVFAKVGSKLLYTYDFGDGWEHSIVLEKRLPIDPQATYPLCTGGELACPPEDCGGLGGFYSLLETMADPSHDQHDEMMEWLGGEFDPKSFSIDDVNRMFAPRIRRRRKAAGR